jgi:hypothetical protein
VLTTLKFPKINDRVFKYVFELTHANTEIAFPTRIMQKVGDEVKPLPAFKPSTISFYADIDEVNNKGLEIDVWLDPVVDAFDYTISIDYYGSLSLFTDRFKTLLISQCFSVLFFVYADVLLNKGF